MISYNAVGAFPITIIPPFISSAKFRIAISALVLLSFLASSMTLISEILQIHFKLSFVREFFEMPELYHLYVGNNVTFIFNC